MEITEVAIKSVDSEHIVKINGLVIEKVTDYKIITSANGSTEVILKIKYSGDIKSIVILDSREKNSE